MGRLRSFALRVLSYLWNYCPCRLVIDYCIYWRQPDNALRRSCLVGPGGYDTPVTVY